MPSADSDFLKLIGVPVSPGITSGRAVVLGADPGDDAGENPNPEPVILVGHAFSPEDVLSMDAGMVCGFVTEAGGVTAPAGIVARSSGIPAVLACAYADVVQTGDFLVVDGYRGEVLVNPPLEMIALYDEQRAQNLANQGKMDVHRYLPAETKDGFKVEIFANINMVDGVAHAVISGASGIGLLRSEFYYLTDDGVPSEEFLFSLYQHALTTAAPLPVTIRTLDLSGGAQVHGLPIGAEQNPALGMKGIRFSLHYADVFKTQLRALYRASAFGKLRILLPMISSCDELMAAKAILAEVQDELALQGERVADDVEIGIMIEVPAAVFIATDLAHEVDFFSIGSNDLIQYGLAVDRVNAQIAHCYDPLQPGFLRMLDQVIQAGHDAGIEVGVCGEMAGEQLYTPLFLGLGVDWLSMPASSIAGAKKMVRDSRASDCNGLAAHLVQESSSMAANRYLQEYHKAHTVCDVERTE